MIRRASLLLFLGLAGCSGDAINTGARTTFLTSEDLVTMTDRMAAAIASNPRVAAVTAQKPMVIVLWPVQNETNQIIPPSQGWLYVHRIRYLMASKPQLQERFRFVLNRRDYEALRREEGLPEGQLGPSEDRLKPEYALTGTFHAATDPRAKRRSDYYLCTFRLTKITPDGTAGELLWEDGYETRKMTRKELLD